MRIRVDRYNPEWKESFELIQGELVIALRGINIVGVEHVGSTSVPGLAAKPIIDVDIVVTPENVRPTIAALAHAGYWYEGERGVTDRHALRTDALTPARNLYVILQGCLALKNHLSVRDVLRKDPDLRREYGAEKMALSKQEHPNMDAYCFAKNAILQRILEKAGLTDLERAEIKMCNSPVVRIED